MRAFLQPFMTGCTQVSDMKLSLDGSKVLGIILQFADWPNVWCG